MPEVVGVAAARLGVEVRLGQPFGRDPALTDLMVERLRAARAGEGDLLLFVGRGSSEPRARADTVAVAAEVARRAGLAHEVCYAGISRPDLGEGMGLALRHRPRRVLALPYLIHTGVLHRRVSEVLGPIVAEEGWELVVLPHVGNAAEVVDVLVDRIQALLAVPAPPAEAAAR